MPSKLSSLTIFFPCLNESENLRYIIPEAFKVLGEISNLGEVIVIDDGSTDNTLQVVMELQKIYPTLKIVSHEKNLGYGAALRTGIASASMDWVFWTDADMQFKLASLMDFLTYTSDFDVIIGYRKHRADTFIRRVNGELYTQLIRFLFHIHVRDVDCAFKLIRRDLLQSLHLTSAGAFTSAEILINLHRKNIEVKQLPVAHFARKFGASTGGSIKVIFKGLRETVHYFLVG